jgi:hypothetical protein
MVARWQVGRGGEWGARQFSASLSELWPWDPSSEVMKAGKRVRTRGRSPPGIRPCPKGTPCARLVCLELPVGRAESSDATRSETLKWAGMEACAFSRIRATALVSRVSSRHAPAAGDPGGARDHNRGVRRRRGHRVSRRRRGRCTEPGEDEAAVARCVSDDPTRRYVPISTPGRIGSTLADHAIPADVCRAGERSSPERRRVCAHTPRSLRGRDSAASQGCR